MQSARKIAAIGIRAIAMPFMIVWAILEWIAVSIEEDDEFELKREHESEA